VRDALLAAHFYVTEKEVADPETTAIEQGGFLAVLSPHDPITVEELSDVGEFHVPGSRRKPALMSLLALLADANSLMRGTT
jgi:arginine/ornithine N-succinyltransferase beta subunit